MTYEACHDLVDVSRYITQTVTKALRRSIQVLPVNNERLIPYSLVSRFRTLHLSQENRLRSRFVSLEAVYAHTVSGREQEVRLVEGREEKVEEMIG